MSFQITQLAVGGFDSNFSYLITAEDGETALVDPCGNAELIRQTVESASVKPKWLLLTHAHPDHYDALEEVSRFFRGPLCAAKKEMQPDVLLKDRLQLPLGSGSIECLATPGHSADSFCFYLSDHSALFTGDTLFVGYIGFCRPRSMFSTLHRLAKLPDTVRIYPGHNYGDQPFSDIGTEKRTNPFFITDSFEKFHASLHNLC